MKNIINAYFSKLSEDEGADKAQLLALNKMRASMTSKEYERRATPIQHKIDRTIDLYERMNKALLLYEELIQVFKNCEPLAENAYQNKLVINILDQLQCLGCKIRQVPKNDPLSYFASCQPPTPFVRPEIALENGPILPWYN
ncbi:MAG: hypothetical protein PHF20_07015 [Halothiobacillaceae bacterium]|nr:hypothetical protein [Halothiobacillaceae bacterium]